MTAYDSKDPIAITGIGCRFPGGIISPETFWDLLREGRDGITQVPKDRWDIKAYYHPQKGIKGKVYTKRGGFLDNIDGFDPRFFNISPREANFMDPQQRILLEVAWEALEDGGFIPPDLGGSNIAVFVGVFAHDYENMQGYPIERPLINPHSSLGIAASIIANRISHFFDFRGPSMVIDTACSSSLVAIHLACRRLLRNESDMALAGGVNVIIKPELTMALCEAGMLSPEGYCKTFDAGADGYARAEGAAMLVLKRLSRALADNDPVYAVIRGSAVNHDGRGDGLSFPNADAQKKVLREALKRAEVAPHEVQYMEAHGTGTPAGDPVESNALGAVLSEGRTDGNPCFVGSVKTNFGHTESAAGAAGLIKTALMLKHRMIAPNLHFNTPNPAIDFDRLKLKVPIALAPWTTNNTAARIAGVNSFGFGGANACVILEEFDAPDHQKVEDISVSGDAAVENEIAFLLPFSGHTAEALEAVAASTLDFLKDTRKDRSIGPADIGRTAALNKGHHEHRLTIVSRSKDELVQSLEAFLSGEKRPGISTGTRDVKPVKLAFVFSGMGQQWWSMGRDLLRKEKVFEDTLARCDAVLARYTSEWSLIRELTAAEDESRIDESRIAQPCIVSLQIALAELYRSWGVFPDVVLGHSVGEIAAAHAAGILSLEDALLVAFHRSRLQQMTAGSGGMLAAGLSDEVMDDLLRTSGYHSSVNIAAVNAPESVTLSGDIRSLEEIEEMLVSENIFARFLNVDVPYHSPAMDDILPELTKALETLDPRPAAVPFFSTVTGDEVDGSRLDAAYWAKNVRSPVRFMDGFRELARTGIDIFMELGAHPVLGLSMTECLAALSATGGSQKGVVLSTLKRKAPEHTLALDAAGRLYCRGYPVAWKRLYDRFGTFIKLPSYPFQRAHYWNESDASRKIRIGTHAGIYPSAAEKIVHPLLGARLSSAIAVWQADIDPRSVTYLADHVIQGAMVYPAAAFAETAIAAARQIHGDLPLAVEDFEIRAPLILENDNHRTLQAVVERATFISIHAKPDRDESAWTEHARGRIEKIPPGSQSQPVSILDIRKRCLAEFSREDFYRRLSGAGLAYGKQFQGIEHIRIGDHEALGKLKIGGTVTSELSDYHLHPVILDVCFQMMACFPLEGSYLPVKIDRLAVYSGPGEKLWGHVKLVDVRADRIKGDIALLDAAGNLLAQVQGLQCHLLPGTGDSSTAGPASDSIENLVYTYEWRRKTLPGIARHIVSDTLPSPHAIAKSLAPDIHRYWTRFKRAQHYRVFEHELDRLAIAYILEAMLKLNWHPKKGERLSSDQLAGRLGIAERHRLLFNRLLHILKKEKYLNGGKERWEVAHEFGSPDASKIWNRLIKGHPSYVAELNLARRCGTRLAEVLKGEEDPLSIIFTQGSTLMEHLYQSSPSFLIYNRIAAGVMSAVLDRLPRGETLRILEIGAGTGALTAHILPLLPKYRAAYVFTDLSGAFVRQAANRFQPFGIVDYKTLDIESDPSSQGFSPHSFDIVLEANAIHAVSDLDKALNHIKSLLKPHGMLILLEGTTRRYALDLTFGMLEGWWLFSDFDLRPCHPVISGEKWTNLLAKSGYVEPVCIADRKEKPSLSVIVAKKKGEERPFRADARIDTVVETGAHPRLAESEIQRPWIVFMDRQGIAAKLVARLESRRIPLFLIEDKERFRGETGAFEMLSAEIERILQKACGDDTAAPVLVNLWSLDTHKEITGDSLEKDTTETCVAVIAMVQTLMKRDWARSPELWLVTAGTRAVGSLETIAIAQAPIWGLARSIMNEYQDLNLRLVDLSPEPSTDEIRALLDELFSGDLEDEIALRGQARYVHRFVRKKERISTAPQDVPFALRHRGRGVKRLVFVESVPEVPGRGEVAIEVVAAGVNFKDIAKLTGLLENLDLSSDIGFECAGIVRQTGEGVTDFSVGDEVMGIVTNCFASHAIADVRGLIHKPSHFSFEEAATVPVTYVTAYYALHELARIKRNDRILIHTATGGVGLSAIQIARAAGAEVLATAGTPEKREFLRAMDIGYVGDSRSTAFADEVMAFTGGEGVDIVLNTLTGKTLPKSLSVLKPLTGRFVDIVNMYSEDLIPLRAMIKGVSFFTFDLENVFNRDPVTVGILIDAVKNLSGRFEDKTYSPLPHRTFPASDIAGAFLDVQKARHIGKVAVAMDEGGVAVIPAGAKVELRRDGTYLITGGLGGFGLATAKWLAGCGAKHLMLIGRSGASSPEAQRGIEEIRKTGAEVLVKRVDVTRPDQLRELMDHMDRTLPPLKGVIHAAMVLSDEYVMRMSASKLKKVIRPKVLGAWHLHELTRHKPLDFFILFSSFASLVGNPGQANYAAANAFLDSFAHYRRRHNLPALTLSWAAVGESGYLTKHPELSDFLKRQGVTELSLRQVWTMIRHGIEKDLVHAGLLKMDWPVYRRYGLSDDRTRRFSEIFDADETSLSSGSGDHTGGLVIPEDSEARHAFLMDLLGKKVAEALGVPSEELDVSKPLDSYGFDSLMAAELVVDIERMTRVALPKMALLKGGLTIDGLVEIVEKELGRMLPIDERSK